MAKNVVIRPSVREQYQKFMARGRVLFFTAPCGCGKSTLAETLLAGAAGAFSHRRGAGLRPAGG